MKRIILPILLFSFLFIACNKDENDVKSKFNLTTTLISQEGGTVTPTSGEFNDGEKVTLTASVADGYVFEGWTVSGDSTYTTNPLQITIDEDVNVVAHFTYNQDTDGDGVLDKYDICDNTPNGVIVTEEGCPDDTKNDTDDDGVMDAYDACPNTPAGTHVSAEGCADLDMDGVSDTVDTDLNTPAGVPVGSNGATAGFFLDANGVTVKAYPGTEAGMTFKIDLDGDFIGDDGADEYTMVDNTLLNEMLNNGDDVTMVCTSGVTRLYSAMYSFEGKAEFNQDISSWDVSNVYDMWGAFKGAYKFNQDISNWDVSSVLYFTDMFNYAVSFNQDISGWDISSGGWVSRMFYSALSFNQDLSGWDMSNVWDYYGDGYYYQDFALGAISWTLGKPVNFPGSTPINVEGENLPEISTERTE